MQTYIIRIIKLVGIRQRNQSLKFPTAQRSEDNNVQCFLTKVEKSSDVLLVKSKKIDYMQYK